MSKQSPMPRHGENTPARSWPSHPMAEHAGEGACGFDAVCSELRNLCEEYLRKNVEWHARLRELLREHERLEHEQRELLEATLQRLDFTVSHPGGPTADLRGLVAAYERALIAWALASAGGQQNRAAALLGLGPTTLNEKIKRLQIAVPRSLARSTEKAGTHPRRPH